MLKKRLIFSLLVSEGSFQLSRNFTLQKVGSLDWLYNCYNLDAITKSVDELVLLNVDRNQTKESQEKFLDIARKLGKKSFIPVALGGGIRSIEDAYLYMGAGADKLVLGDTLYHNHSLVKELVSIFGGQSIVAAIDYLKKDNKRIVVSSGGKQDVGLDLIQAVKQVEALGVGELIVTSVDQDGTGQGYDLEAYKEISQHVQIPLIASGGVGKFSHLVDGLLQSSISAVNTANIFNFMVNGLTDARLSIEKAGIPLAHWETK